MGSVVVGCGGVGWFLCLGNHFLEMWAVVVGKMPGETGLLGPEWACGLNLVYPFGEWTEAALERKGSLLLPLKLSVKC